MNDEIDIFQHALADSRQISESIGWSTQQQFGVLDAKFLRQSVSVLLSEPAICFPETASLDEVLRSLQVNRIGCILITADDCRLVGIFGERDYMSKLYGKDVDRLNTPVSEYMTREPLTAAPDTPVAYVLNMMCHLGFRHVPITTPDREPIGIVSIRDITDYLTRTLTDDLLKLKVPGF